MKSRIAQTLALAFVALLLLAAVPLLEWFQPVAGAQETAAVSAAVSPLLQYQGRLSDPESSDPVPDGSYTMSLRLYSAPSGGTPLWTETKDVPVSGGLFSTLLGDTTPLAQSLFDGRELWLGVKVGADEEATPRQQLVPVAYALGLVPGAAINTQGAAAALTVANTGTGPALRSNGVVDVQGDLNVTGSLSGGDHAHADYVTQYEFADHIYGGMHNGRYIAAGIIHEDGTVASATANVSSKWNALHKAYEITIDGVSYDHWSYITNVTPIVGGFTSAWGSTGKLFIGIYDLDTKPVKGPFQFVVFQP